MAVIRATTKAAVKASVIIHNEVADGTPGKGVWCLCFQKCTYTYDNGTKQPGYRFIWRRPAGTLQSSRGQTRIEDAAQMQRLTDAAKKAGWFH